MYNYLFFSIRNSKKDSPYFFTSSLFIESKGISIIVVLSWSNSNPYAISPPSEPKYLIPDKNSSTAYSWFNSISSFIGQIDK